MTMRRLDRRRLFEAEKLGKTVDVGTSAVMKDAIVSATQHREGHKVITDVVVDFGSSKVDLKSKAVAANDPIGDLESANNDSFICKVDQSVFGVVTTVESICLEAFSDGTDTDVDLVHGDGDGYLGSDPSNVASFSSNAQEDIMSVSGKVTTTAIDNSLLDTDGSSGKYIYLVAGAATTTTATSTIDLTSAVPANVVSGRTIVRLIAKNGSTAVDFVADSAQAWDVTTPSANTFGIGASAGTGTPAMSTTKRLTYAISNAINKNSNFSTNAASRDKTGDTGSGNDNEADDNLTVITVSHDSVTTTGEHDNFLVDDPQSASGISVGAFTGGIDSGRDITSGKLLLRFTGFVAPSDI